MDWYDWYDFDDGGGGDHDGDDDQINWYRLLALSISALFMAIAGAACETVSNQEVKFRNYKNGENQRKEISDFQCKI